MKEWKFNYQVFSREIQIQNNCSYPQKSKKLLNAWREQNHVTISFLGVLLIYLCKKKKHSQLFISSKMLDNPSTPKSLRK